MSPSKAVYGSIFVSVLVLTLVLLAGNFGGNAMAQPASAPEAAPAAAAQAQDAAGEVTGTALPGDKVVVTQGQMLIGEAIAGADGTWRVPIPTVSAPAVPYHVRILPSERRGGINVEVDGPVSLTVAVIIGATKVEVRVQVTSSNGRIEVDILAPLDPVTCKEPPKPASEQPKPPAQPTAQAAGQPSYHQVKSGETLAGIAKKYGMTTQAMVQANKLADANRIYVGQKLVVPAK
jgi:LysM repeat protein